MTVARGLLRGLAAAAFRLAAANLAGRSPAAAAALLPDIEATIHESARALFLGSILSSLDATTRRTIVVRTLAGDPGSAECALLFPHMTPGERARFDHVAEDILGLAADALRDFDPLAAILPFIDERRLETLWAQTATVRFDTVQAHAMLLLATKRPAWLAEALDRSDLIDQPARVAMLVHVAPHVTTLDQRREVMRRAESAARSLTSYFRAEALLQCAMASSGTERRRLVEDALIAMSETEGKDRDLESVVPFLLDFDLDALEAAFSRILPILASRSRADLARDLAGLALPLRTLATTGGVADVADSIRKASAWWP